MNANNRWKEPLAQQGGESTDEIREGWTASRRWFWMQRALLVFAILFALGVLSMPILLRDHETTGYRMYCLSQVRQIGLAMRMYADQNKNWFPTDRPIEEGVNPLAALAILTRTNYLDDSRVLKCPQDPFAVDDPFDPDIPDALPTRRNCSYSVNALPDIMQTSDPSTALLSDEPGSPGRNSTNHDTDDVIGKGQYVFRVGGDAKWFDTPENGDDPSIFSIDPGVENDAYIPDIGP